MEQLKVLSRSDPYYRGSTGNGLRGSPLEANSERGQVKGLFTTLHVGACAKAMVAHGSEDSRFQKYFNVELAGPSACLNMGFLSWSHLVDEGTTY